MASSIHIDFETFSYAPLKVCGGYRYAQHASTEILCCAWAVDEDEVSIWVPCISAKRARSLGMPQNQFWHYGDAVPAPLAAAVASGMTIIAHNCVTPEHEVLTPSGWVRFDLLTGSELVAQVEPSTGEVTFTTYELIKTPYSGKMYSWDLLYHKGTYTPNHRMYFNTYHDRRPQVKTVQEIIDEGLLDSSVILSGQKLCVPKEIQLDITPDEARFMELIRADGSIEGEGKNGNFGLRFAFKKPRKIERAKRFLAHFKFAYEEFVDPEGNTRIRGNRNNETLNKIAKLFGPKKEYGPWVLRLSSKAQKALLDEVGYWDGSRTPHREGSTFAFSSKDEKTMYWLSTLAALNGMSMRYAREPNTRGFSKPDGIIYRGSIRQRDRAKLQYHPDEIDYTGDVYCVSVPTKAFLIRKETAIWVTGNSSFERAIWQAIVVRRHGGPPTKRTQFVCTAARAAAANLPRGLDGVGMALETGEQKDKEGGRLLKMFAMPRKPTKNDHRTRIMPAAAPGEFRALCAYCIQDVRTERDVDKIIPHLHPREQELFAFDMQINERGLRLDIPSVKLASTVLAQLESNIVADVQRRTVSAEYPQGLRPTQRDKMMKFFTSIGVELENMQADHVRKYLKANIATLHPLARELLLLRIEAGKSSTKKLVSMAAYAGGDDHRARGTLLFNGASTGRWCIEEDTPVIVMDEHGAIRTRKIQHVRIVDKLWDGTQWVTHAGVIASGEKDTMSYDGVQATPEHDVWVSEDQKMKLKDASATGTPVWKSKPWAVYCITFANGKRYFGISTRPGRRAVQHSKGESGRMLANAFKSHGEAHFRILKWVDGESAAKSLEKELIARYKTNQHAYGYNMTIGGDSGPGFSKEVQLAASAKGAARLSILRLDPEYSKSLNAAVAQGVRASTAHKEANRAKSLARKGKPAENPEACRANFAKATAARVRHSKDLEELGLLKRQKKPVPREEKNKRVAEGMKKFTAGLTAEQRKAGTLAARKAVVWDEARRNLQKEVMSKAIKEYWRKKREAQNV